MSDKPFGEWSVQCKGAMGITLYAVRSDIGEIVMSPATGAKAHARAHLIAAAPDLLAAAVDLVDILDLEDPSGGLSRKLRAAIQKARVRA